MFLTDYGNLSDTIITEKTDLNSNNSLEITYLILSSLYIGSAKYRIYSGKTETATNTSGLRVARHL